MYGVQGSSLAQKGMEHVDSQYLEAGMSFKALLFYLAFNNSDYLNKTQNGVLERTSIY